ncbi:MAG: carboxypeptidase-like regulatory domain-containing protein, partial [Bacteroidales bacterium]|nr:carboxypeptidase-like regulatory domain-containing protein [Bacteroidales bacterium]
MQSNKNIRHNQLLLQLLLWIFIFVAQAAPAQSHTPSASKDTLSFKALIDSLSRRYNLSFAYDALAISDDSLFCVDFSRAPDKRWIASLFENDSVEVSFIGSQVIIGRLQGAPSLPEVIKIYGLVKDAAINEALAMVNISLEGEPLGTSTNDAGAFEFKLPRSFQGRRIVFSSLGFANIYMEVPANDTLVDIGMKSLSIPLPEVQVMYRDPMKIM